MQLRLEYLCRDVDELKQELPEEDEREDLQENYDDENDGVGKVQVDYENETGVNVDLPMNSMIALPEDICIPGAKGEKSGNIEIKASEESVVVHKKEEIKQPKDDIIDADKADEDGAECGNTKNHKMDIGDIIDGDGVINTIETIFVVIVNTSPDVLLFLTQALVHSPAHWGLSQEKDGLPQWDPGG